MLLITAVVMTPHCRGGDGVLRASFFGVAGGASLVMFTADQIVITVFCSVPTESSLHTAAPIVNEGSFHPYTATIRTGVGGIISCPFAVFEGVETPPPRLVTVKILTVLVLVGR